jgi:hypothetical protein
MIGGEMRVPLVFAFLIALLSISLPATDSVPVGRLAGVVADSEGAVISNAIVLVHWAGQGADAARGSPAGLSEDLRLTTDGVGQFSTDLSPGFYDIAVFAKAFSPKAFKVRLRSGKTAPANVKLAVDQLMCEEFCDTFEAPAARPPDKKKR